MTEFSIPKSHDFPSLFVNPYFYSNYSQT
jgi:hypothetical protein